MKRMNNARGHSMRWRLWVALSAGMGFLIPSAWPREAASPVGRGAYVDVDRVFARSRLSEEFRSQLGAAVRPLEEQFHRAQFVAELTAAERSEMEGLERKRKRTPAEE